MSNTNIEKITLFIPSDIKTLLGVQSATERRSRSVIAAEAVALYIRLQKEQAAPAKAGAV